MPLCGMLRHPPLQTDRYYSSPASNTNPAVDSSLQNTWLHKPLVLQTQLQENLLSEFLKLCVVCVCVARKCECASGSQQWIIVSLSTALHSIFWSRSLTKLRAARLPAQHILGTGLSLHPRAGVTDVLTRCCMRRLCRRWNLNSGLCSCAASTVPIEPAHRPGSFHSREQESY